MKVICELYKHCHRKDCSHLIEHEHNTNCNILCAHENVKCNMKYLREIRENKLNKINENR